jgi:hypothetical protein
MKFSKFTIAALLLLLSSMIYAQPPYQWVQMVANDQLSVRAILLKDESYPKVSVDNILTAMQLRAPKMANFPAVCELLDSRDTQSIKIQQPIRIPSIPIVSTWRTLTALIALRTRGFSVKIITYMQNYIGGFRGNTLA